MAFDRRRPIHASLSSSPLSNAGSTSTSNDSRRHSPSRPMRARRHSKSRRAGSCRRPRPGRPVLVGAEVRLDVALESDLEAGRGLLEGEGLRPSSRAAARLLLLLRPCAARAREPTPARTARNRTSSCRPRSASRLRGERRARPPRRPGSAAAPASRPRPRARRRDRGPGPPAGPPGRARSASIAPSGETTQQPVGAVGDHEQPPEPLAPRDGGQVLVGLQGVPRDDVRGAQRAGARPRGRTPGSRGARASAGGRGRRRPPRAAPPRRERRSPRSPGSGRRARGRARPATSSGKRAGLGGGGGIPHHELPLLLREQDEPTARRVDRHVLQVALHLVRRDHGARGIELGQRAAVAHDEEAAAATRARRCPRPRAPGGRHRLGRAEAAGPRAPRHARRRSRRTRAAAAAAASGPRLEERAWTGPGWRGGRRPGWSARAARRTAAAASGTCRG